MESTIRNLQRRIFSSLSQKEKNYVIWQNIKTSYSTPFYMSKQYQVEVTRAIKRLFKQRGDLDLPSDFNPFPAILTAFKKVTDMQLKEELISEFLGGLTTHSKLSDKFIRNIKKSLETVPMSSEYLGGIFSRLTSAYVLDAFRSQTRLNRERHSIEVSVDDGESFNLMDKIPDTSHDPYNEYMDEESLITIITKQLRSLSPLEAVIMKYLKEGNTMEYGYINDIKEMAERENLTEALTMANISRVWSNLKSRIIKAMRALDMDIPVSFLKTSSTSTLVKTYQLLSQLGAACI